MSIINQALPAEAGAAAKGMFSSRDAFWLAIVVFLLPVIYVQYTVLQFTGGTFTYPVDDTFIHLAIAKNLAFHHVWGISPHGFVSASSSVLYPLILAGSLLLFGDHAIIPFIINLIAAIVFLFMLHKWLIRQHITPVAQLCVLIAVIVVIPLPVIALSGMEHTLQILFSFLFVYQFSDELARSTSDKPKKNLSWSIYLYGLLLTATRYEGMILVGIACLLLLWRRRVLPALLLGFISFLPILLFGLYSLSHGSYFIPNSVLLKSGAPPLTADGLWQFFTQDLYDKLSFSTIGYNTVATQRMLIILPLTWLLFRPQLKKATQYQYIILLLAVATFIHILLTGRGRFPRYEAYLLGNGTIITATLVARYWKEGVERLAPHTRWVAAGFALFLVIPILMRSKDAFGLVNQASINIYQQQYQMGKFLGKYYHDTNIAFNDIGAVSYFTQGNNVDLWGLGNLDITRSIKESYETPQFMINLCKKDDVQIAVVFENYFPQQLTHRWSKIGSWQVLDNVICADDSVSFYAVDKQAEAGLKQNLRAYQSSLPRGVIARYY